MRAATHLERILKWSVRIARKHPWRVWNCEIRLRRVTDVCVGDFAPGENETHFLPLPGRSATGAGAATLGKLTTACRRTHSGGLHTLQGVYPFAFASARLIAIGPLRTYRQLLR